MSGFYCGKDESIPYSLSRWTDLPGTAKKWEWFKHSVAEGKMEAFDPRTGIPVWWSLHPDDTLGLVFWTRQPKALLESRKLLEPYSIHIHMTVTGWREVEHKAPTLVEGSKLLSQTLKSFGPLNVTWRFSPIPDVPDVLDRFERIAEVAAKGGLEEVFLSFLQTNDRMTEHRGDEEKMELLHRIAERAYPYPMKVQLCNEDRLLLGKEDLPCNLQSGICAPPEKYSLEGRGKAPSEGCGCVLMADPFTITESCSYGCEYCYAADQSLSPKKRNTTRLPIIR